MAQWKWHSPVLSDCWMLNNGISQGLWDLPQQVLFRKQFPFHSFPPFVPLNPSSCFSPHLSFLLSFSPSSFSPSFWRTAHTIVHHDIILLAIRKLWKPRKTETLWQNSSEQWLQGHSALGSTSTMVSSASGRRDPELGWQEDKEAQKNIRKRWRKMHCFLEWDRQRNPAGICLEFYVAPWSIFKSLMCFFRTSGINWTADFWKSLSFESSRVKSFCIINSLSHSFFHFLALLSLAVRTGQLTQWFESIWQFADTNEGVWVHCCVCLSSYSLWFIMIPFFFHESTNVSDFTRIILLQKPSPHCKSFYKGTQEAGIICMLFPLFIDFNGRLYPIYRNQLNSSNKPQTVIKDADNWPLLAHV